MPNAPSCPTLRSSGFIFDTMSQKINDIGIIPTYFSKVNVKSY